MEKPDSWRNRGVWVEQDGDRTFVKAVGIAPNASMGRTFSMPSAEEDARAKISEYIGAVVKTFRERLQRVDVSIVQDGDGEAFAGAQGTQRNDNADRSVAENMVRGMETLNTYVDPSSDELFVLARVDLEQVLESIASSDALSSSERALVNSNAAEVRREFEAATRASEPR